MQAKVGGMQELNSLFAFPIKNADHVTVDIKEKTIIHSRWVTFILFLVSDEET